MNCQVLTEKNDWIKLALSLNILLKSWRCWHRRPRLKV